MFEYNPEDIIVHWGESTLGGFAEGSFVNGERTEDATSVHAGSHGDITATINAARHGFVTANFVQQSPTNAELYAALHKQERLKKLQKRSLSITDLSGAILVSAPNAWLRKVANADFGKEQANRSWIFDCDRLLFLPGAELR